LFDNLNDAQKAMQELVNNGFRSDEISLVSGDENGRPANASEVTGGTASAAAGGAGAGAILGGLAGLLIGLGTLAVPGVGPVLAAGPLAAALAGAGIGAVTGGLIGALVDSGVPEEEARYYAEGVRRGGILISIRTPDDSVESASVILNRYHPVDIHQRATEWQEAGWSGVDRAEYSSGSDTSDFANYEPEFRRNYETAYGNMGYSFDQYRPAYRYGYDLATGGRYRDWKWDRLEPELRRDWEQRYPQQTWSAYRDAVQFGWERGHSQTSGAAGQNIADYPGDRTPNGPDLNENAARWQMEGGGAGSQYRGSENAGAGVIRGPDRSRSDQSSATETSVYDSDFRQHYAANYRGSGYDYDQYRPAYQFGSRLANDRRYRGRNWDEVEPEARRSWEQDNPTSTWDEIKEAIHHGWTRMMGRG
jgi:hypothetical protein